MLVINLIHKNILLGRDASQGRTISAQPGPLGAQSRQISTSELKMCTRIFVK